MPSVSGTYCKPRRPPARRNASGSWKLLWKSLSLRSTPTAGAMISPGGSDGPSCTVTIPMLSTSIFLSGFSGSGASTGAADDHRIEALVLAQLVLPVDERLELLRAAGLQAVDRVFGHDREKREVDRVDAFAQDGPLAAALAQDRLVLGARRLAPQEAPGVLEVVAGNDLAQRLARRQRLAVAGIDIADLALRHRDQGHLVDAVLPPPEAEMQPAAQHLRLKPGLAIEGDDPPLRDRTLQRPELLDDPDPVVGDVTQARKLAGCNDQYDQADDPEKAPRQVGQSRQERRRSGGNHCRQPRSHVLNKRRAHSETPLVNERDADCSKRNNP